MTLLFHSWNDESVVYNASSADLHLLSSFNAELLSLIKKEAPQPMLMTKISDYYQIAEMEAKKVLDDLISEYLKLGLLD